MSPKLLAFLLVAVSAANALYIRDVPQPTIDVGELGQIFSDYADDEDSGELAQRVLHSVYPQLQHLRLRRQVHGSMSTNPSGSTNINLQAPLVRTDHTQLSAIAAGSGLGASGYERAGAGLAFGTDRGHGATLVGSHIPGFGDQLTAAGKVNLLTTDAHRLDATAFGSRTFPSNPAIPNFNTYGGGVDYMFKDRVGASLSAAHTPLFQKTDYSAMGNLNLFKDRTSSLDFNAGLSKSVSPFIPSRSWQPAAGLTFTKYW